MDRITAEERASRFGAAAMRAGINLSTPQNPDVGELLASILTLGLAVTTIFGP